MKDNLMCFLVFSNKFEVNLSEALMFYFKATRLMYLNVEIRLLFLQLKIVLQLFG